MKKFKLIVFVILINLLATLMFAGNININNSYSSDTIINPFNTNPIFGLSFTGNINLNSDTSLVRIILETQTGEEYMLYEAYPLISNSIAYSVQNKSDETMYLDGIQPSSLRVEIINSTLTIDFLTTTDNSIQNAISLQATAKYNNDISKIDIINSNIVENGYSWTAGYNSIVQEFYMDKKARWGEKYNLKGYDYYAGGVYENSSENYAYVPTTNYIHNWDWRNRHGANDPESAYFDGDSQYGSGWLTPSKNQDLCGSCGVFSTLGSLESTINLYYNQQVDFDLSEQQQISCNPMVSCAGGWPFDVVSYIKNNYVVEEACYPYISGDGNCYDVCNNPDTKISVGSVTEHWMDQNLTVSDVQLLLKQKGPLSWVKNGGAHAVTLVGWTYDEAASRINFIYKENLGPDNWGVGGFGIEPAPSTFVYIGVANEPVFLTPNEPDQLLLDADGDGIDNWGIGSKPPGASNYIDCDDNNPLLGSFSADFSCQCLAQYNTTPIPINTTVYWDSPMALEQPVSITAGGELIITSKVFIQKDVIIKVKPGGRLIIDGGTLTKACNDIWKGIEVIGDNSIPQLPHSNQGYLLIKNNGSINFAETAVLVGATDPFSGELDYNKSGGIIISRNSSFLNNRNDVKFLSYYDPQYIANESEFKNTVFETDNSTFVDFIPENHLELNGVYGIAVEGCKFDYVLQTEVTSPIADDLGTGILVIDASVNIISGCSDPNTVPCPQSVPTTFQNLRYGIRAFNTGTNKLFSVTEAELNNNIVGIYMSGYNQCKVYNNEFVSDNSSINISNMADPYIGGVYLDGCTGYTIEENEFSGSYHIGAVISAKLIGIYIKDSGEDDNEIYNNTLHNLTFPIIAEGINKGESTGLTIKCNDLYDNLNDLYVVSDPLNPNPKGLVGIKSMQGAPVNNTEMMAGNTFTDWFDGVPAYSNYLWNYNNQGEHITYFHHAPDLLKQLMPLDNNYTDGTITLNNPFNITYSKSEACPSHISGGNERTVMATASASISSYNSQLAALTDGGDTDATNNDIAVSVQDEGLVLRDQLIADSPYLSDTVMKSAIEKEDVLLNSMLRDVLVENPQSAKNDAILDAIDNRVDEMPGYMMNEILGGKEIVGDKEVLQSKLEFWKNERSRALNSLVRSFMEDTTNLFPYDSIINVYQAEEDVNSKYKLAISYADKGDLTSASSTINDIPLDFELNGFQSSVNDAYVDYFSILDEMKTDTLLASGLDSNSVSILNGIADSELPLVSSFARGLLVKGGLINYHESIYLPSTNKSKRIYPDDRPSTELNSSGLRLMPNPAKNFVVVEYDLGLDSGKGIIIVRDLKGTTIKYNNLTASKNQITLDLVDVPSGVYIISLYSGNKLMDSKRLSKID